MTVAASCAKRFLSASEGRLGGLLRLPAADSILSYSQHGLACSSLSGGTARYPGLVARPLSSPTLKGKEKALDLPLTSTQFEWLHPISRRQSRYLARKGLAGVGLQATMTLRHNTARSFHSTARRDAIPLIPAGLAIFKTTSILTVITTISRILISFFPLGTIAAFRSVRGVRWLADDAQKPVAGEEAEEFWRMWCNGERAIKPTREELRLLLEADLDSQGAILLPDGRQAWAYPRNPRMSSPKYRKYIDPKVLREDPDGEFTGFKERAKLGILASARFFLPPLPPASISYFEALSPDVQTQVTALRRYWVSLHAFKDQLFWSRIVVFSLLILPCLLLCGVYAFALERVPFTGRWRIILLTAEDEDKISSSLAGPNWYKSVINLLTTPEAPAPPVLPLTDWRWRWVEGVLRRLEDGIIAAVAAAEAGEPDAWEATPGGLSPPASKYPLRPRPRVSTRLHSVLPGGDPQSGQEHLELGPPFSLMLMEKADRNAFSYGFGGKGAGGIVVFTGLLDDVLAHDQTVLPEEPIPAKKAGGIFGGLFSTPDSRPAPVFRPSEEQELHLACVLAHEMGHLLLSHHLETLSQQQVLWPSLLGLTMDLIRAFIWPLTIFLGPAVNDALANMGRSTTEELVDRYGEIGFQWKHEYEADLVGLRILARAGFEPQLALKHFAKSVPDLHEIQPLDKDDSESWTGSLFKLWTRATHPSRESRLAAVEAELRGWRSAEDNKGQQPAS